MNARRVQFYVIFMCLAAAFCLATTDWASLGLLPRSSLIGLAGLVAVALLSESVAIGIGGSAGGNSSITFLPLLASVQLFGPVGGLVLALSTLSFVEFVVRRKPFDRAVFNVSQCVVATTLAGSAFVLLGGEPIQGLADPDITGQLWPFLSFGLLFMVMNHAAVALAIALSHGMPFRKVWQKALDSTASLNDLLISPIALAIAFLYVQFGIPGIVVVLFPMLFIQYSYRTTSRLRDSNSDLLTALVKAIEIRDPYTSGHSVRVSKLAQQIAEELGLNRITVDRITNAALLHDIGKIEEIYTEILRKPDALTSDERAIIESHVTRGEQLLRDLSSVPEEVVKIVRHHHEREDGAGYPDGLLGDEIPIGSKIIVACDAVDAMLSDRPYRKALPLAIVVEQLNEHAGRQFDHRVVRALVQSTILESFADTMRAAREQQALEKTGDRAPAIPSMSAPMTRPASASAGRYH
jgi:putative nucleotidyltransferase with HDIG domain